MRIKQLDIQSYAEYLQNTRINDEKKNLLLEYAERLIQNNMPVIWDMRHFSILLGVEYSTILNYINNQEYHYHKIYIPKKAGGVRELDIPSVSLKEVQGAILNDILENIQVSNKAYAFVKGRSIVDNAKNHINKQYLVNLDLKDFFGTIKYEQVFRIFYYYGYTKQVSYMLSMLVTKDGILPQGAPTSPYISNIVCLRLDKRLSKLAEKIGCSYSRYADDITFSGDIHPHEYLYLVRKIIEDEKFTINNKKTRIQSNNYRQEVTGIIVNNKLKVNVKYKRYIRQQIYYIKKFGIDEHLKAIKCDYSGYKEHIYGVAYFIKMVEPDEGMKWIKELNQINWYY